MCCSPSFIHPGVFMQQFNKAVNDAYGATAVLSCDSKGNINGLTQCVSKQLKLMPCPANVTPSCSATNLYRPATMYSM